MASETALGIPTLRRPGTRHRLSVDQRLRDRMTRDVEDLARRHRVRVTWVQKHPTWGEAFTELREAVVMTIRRPSDYLLALHELGHIVSREARRTVERIDSYGAVLCEGAAWAWAAAAADPVLVRRIPAKEWDRAMFAFRSHMAVNAKLARDTTQTAAFLGITSLIPVIAVSTD